jgi:hypothetical protein
MSLDCISFQIKKTSRLKSTGSFKAATLATLSPIARLSGVGKFKAGLTKRIGFTATMTVDSSFEAKTNMSFGLQELSQHVDSHISARLTSYGNLNIRFSSSSEFYNSYVDKFAGSITKINSFDDFQATEKLYPIKDIITVLDGYYFVDKNLGSGNLYSSINEGIFVGNYTKNFKNSTRISDEITSYIQPSSIFTDGDFKYKFEVTTPTQVAKESFLFIRASAPTNNYISHVAPRYTLSNIKLEDPSGNLIIKYKDIILRGDSNYELENVNYSTYISEPEVNNLLLYTWDKDYPLMQEASGYTLNIDVNSTCLDDPFNTGFNFGYEDDCSTSGINLSSPENYPATPTNNLRISTIEICNSGGVGILRDNYLNFYSEVSPIGQRISRSIFPVQVLTKDFSSNVYPEVNSTWKSSNSSTYNTSASGANVLNGILINDYSDDYITLNYIDGIADSGKLNLKFSHKPPTRVIEYQNGAFSFGKNNNFDSATLSNVAATDNFFTIDSVELKVRARKAVGSRDYVLDIVGYSDDKLLNVTPAVGGFLQNVSGVGTLPSSSGFNPSNELAISSETLSDKDEFYTSSLTNNDGGDHYQLATSPVVNSTSFADYTIPLKIYEDRVAIGKSKDYSMSSSFEHLYLDIYPIPSGASISKVELIVYYKPTNALMLHTLGQAEDKEINLRTVKIYPSSRQVNDGAINSTDDYSLSLIENIPHGYKTPVTLKTNYSRRWRGVEGSIVSGPFNPYEFDFSFYNPQLNTPFLNGYFSFNNDSNGFIISDSIPNITPVSGQYVGSYNKIKNIGLRFNSSSLFSQSTPYRSIDWTSIAGYENNNLFGFICDSYDNAVRVSGHTGYIDFGNIDTASGFSIFTRFSPDINMSGVNYNLWNSGIILSKFDSGKNLEFALGYENGYLTGYARASNGTIHKVQDSDPYYLYSYPISTILTYNDNRSQKLKLYTDTELAASTWNFLRDESPAFTMSSSNSKLTFGYSEGSGVGFNGFITDIGISTYNSSGTNILSSSSNIDRLSKQIVVDDFFDTIRHKFWDSVQSAEDDRFKLWKYIDEDVDDWKLGAFKICSFSPAYDSFTKRIGDDYIIHRLKHDGSPYSLTTNTVLPSNVPASSVAYHTQIENDFLRFNLSDIPEANPNFVSAPPRICKTLPRGYDFAERAMVVDTVIQYETFNDIVWSDGKIGPKLIVSLYTKNQEPVDRPSKVNWGLINRHTHYLEPSGCWEKLSSTFDFNDLIDTSEPWANFDPERNASEFNTKYYSTDINDMFLQYDLVYPSGRAFEATIKIHSANVRLENALVQANSVTAGPSNNTQFNLVCSGESISLTNINLYSYGLDNASGVGGLNLFSSGMPIPTASSVWNNGYGMNLMCSGAVLSSGTLPLYTLNIGNIDSSDGNYSSFDIFGASPSFGPILFVDGRFNQFDEQELNLFTKNLLSSQTASGNISLFLSNKLISDYSLSSLGLYAFSNTTGDSRYPNSRMSLYTELGDVFGSVGNSLNLYVAAQDYTVTNLEDSLPLFIINYLAYNQDTAQQAAISWNSDNVGKNISVDDNIYSTLSANDEIRGVDLICYGNCETENSCEESGFTIHDKTWYNDSCVDGGIFRANNTYTNLSTSGFNSPIGYSGHFYGIRKYTDLIPNAPYKVFITGKTGSNNYISVPPEIEDINYYIEGFGQSGIKLIGDEPYVASGRQVNAQYGKSVAIKNDLIAIGSPFSSVSDPVNYVLEDAGTVFLYRRLPAPSGNSWSLNINEHKSPWVLEEQINLPSGYIRDYYTTKTRTLVAGFEPITERYWKVGQEGRQFGHSLDLAIYSGNNSLHEPNKEVLVVGGPSSSWSRTFESVNPSSVQIGLMIFTDEFIPKISDVANKSIKTYINVLNSIKDKDIIFKYFSSPPTAFDVKLIILEPTLDDTESGPSEEFPNPKPTFITKKRIHRRQGSDLQTEKILSGIKEAFNEAFPYNEGLINNNIPPIVGFYIDNSASLGKESLNGDGGGAIDQFISYYQQYSFESGVSDFYGTQSSGAITEFIPTFIDAEDWIKMSQDILNHTLDTGRLVLDDQVKYITSGVGSQYFNPNLGEFNDVPTSGGRVYIFEKESGTWSLIQQIDSPADSYGIPDRFGHAVAISNNTEVIAIGSPYINNACEIYEYNNDEKLRLYSNIGSWINLKSSQSGGIGRYAKLRSEYITNRENLGLLEAGKTLYVALNTTERFDVRRYLNINEYANIKSFRYSDVSILGTWEFIPQKFLPTPRLGYSVAVNEDGTIVAFGSPTDSLNQWDDGNVWYKNDGYNEPLNIDGLNGVIKSSWQSNTNAGAVRLFESRNYYSHNKVVEFTKFGNLEESISSPENSGHFRYLSQIFQNYNFEKTEFSDLSIPKEAGLAFIITPEIDAVSEEILDKLVKWLELGDRNLVLVGNDPLWENNGIYLKSNDIINKILSGLKSRMRLHPARNQYEALVSGCDFNVIPSFRPSQGSSTYIQPQTLKGYGVADIRMHLPNYRYTMPCDLKDVWNNPINSQCQMPLIHNGDLRAEWLEQCDACSPLGTITYPVNWPLVFKNFTPICCQQSDIAAPRYDLTNLEPIPLLVAAESVVNTVTYPAIPERYEYLPRYRYETRSSSTPITRVEFDNSNIGSGIEFIWSSSSGNYTYLNTNYGNTNSLGRFFDPELFDDRDSLLQSSATSREETVKEKFVLDDSSTYCAQQNYENSSSKVILIAGVVTESRLQLYNGAGDRNINFYANVAYNTENLKSNIAQLGGWTNRTNFQDGYKDSHLNRLFINLGHTVDVNVQTLYSTHDICWIANPDTLPNNEEINSIKNWLNIGNKKLVITYGDTQSKARIISQLCSLLGISITPHFLDEDNAYPIAKSTYLVFNGSSNLSGSGKTKISEYQLIGSIPFVPIKTQDVNNRVCYGDASVMATRRKLIGYWQMKSGVAKVNFPVIAGSGYKIFIDTVSETSSETASLNVSISNVSMQAGLPYPMEPESFPIVDLNNNSDQFVILENAPVGVWRRLSPATIGFVNTYSVNIQIPSGMSTLTMYFDGNDQRLDNQNKTYAPKSTRLLAVSGVSVPIISTTTVWTQVQNIQILDGFDKVKTREAIPEETITFSAFRPISTDNTKYCSSDSCIKNKMNDKLIADGPVVAAQESITSFLAGNNRSRITVLADSSFVQGPCMVDENDLISENTINFLRSMYPGSPLNSNFGRQFDTMTKIVAPERGSPQKYYALYNNSGINYLFNNGSTSQSLLSNFDDKESKYDPRYVLRTKQPYDNFMEPEEIERIIKQKIREFANLQSAYGATAKFSGVIEGVLYEDASFAGGMPELMKNTGYDYLNFDRFSVGYPGDLFGYSIDLYNNKLVVGSPFAAFSDESINPWNHYVSGGLSSGIQLGYNGGAGSVYIFEKTYNGSGLLGAKTPWEFTEKLRPESINIGSGNSGHSIIGDRFGYDVAIDNDTMVIGAPGHDYENHIIVNSGSFGVKFFNKEFNNYSLKIYDLGSKSNRDALGTSGNISLNNGAIFTFENKIIDWPTRKQKWTLVQKSVAEGYNSRQRINSYYGDSVAIDMANRTDSDYSIVVGSPFHQYATSGNHSSTQPLHDAGASYALDVMLREQPASGPSKDSFLNARVFGETLIGGNPTINISFKNNNDNNKSYFASGVIYSNNQGEIFLEASGQDPVTKGFIQHRPYIFAIDGQYVYGTPISQGMILTNFGKAVDIDNNMNMYTNVDDNAFVYNNLGMYTSSITGFASGIPSGLYLFTDCPDPTVISNSGLTLFASGIGTDTDTLNLRIRGK